MACLAFHCWIMSTDLFILLWLPYTYRPLASGSHVLVLTCVIQVGDMHRWVLPSLPLADMNIGTRFRNLPWRGYLFPSTLNLEYMHSIGTGLFRKFGQYSLLTRITRWFGELTKISTFICCASHDILSRIRPCSFYEYWYLFWATSDWTEAVWVLQHMQVVVVW